ncbi:male-enhanced antigen 1 [Tachyglossus aculeatus]|uniref:male-enhanced antigen 1 n=1 Tax=Tachyglossus aculeatus TaxID=9261 RepID=UPI0018F76BA2|nr:male-enhanced antigen 1 [Tachyglossus aculeatus]
MGPERVSPSQGEELEPPQTSPDWSEEEEQEQEQQEQQEQEQEQQEQEGPAGYSYQPLSQDAEQEEPEPAQPTADIHQRIQAMGLHLPDPPAQSDEEEDDEGAAALSSRASIPMDPEHVELVKRTMAGVSLPAPGVPAWARELSDAQWDAVVQKTLQARQAPAAWK